MFRHVVFVFALLIAVALVNAQSNQCGDAYRSSIPCSPDCGFCIGCDGSNPPNCIKCGSGSVRKQGDVPYDSCQYCGPGTEANSAQTECKPCPKGTAPYCGIVGLMSDEDRAQLLQGYTVHCSAHHDYYNGCVNCRAGYYSTQRPDGMQACVKCPKGTTSNEKSAYCNICTASNFVTRNNQCVCKAGYYRKSPSLSSCRKSEYVKTGVDFYGKDIPNSGKRVDNTWECDLLCQSIGNCVGWTWATSSYDRAPRMCWPKMSGYTEKSLSNVISGRRNSHEDCQDTCSRCPSGKYRALSNSDSSCSNCPSGSEPNSGRTACVSTRTDPPKTDPPATNPQATSQVVASPQQNIQADDDVSSAPSLQLSSLVVSGVVAATFT